MNIIFKFSNKKNTQFQFLKVNYILESPENKSDTLLKIGYSVCSIYASRLRIPENIKRIKEIISRYFPNDECSKSQLHSEDIIHGNICSLDITNTPLNVIISWLAVHFYDQNKNKLN